MLKRLLAIAAVILITGLLFIFFTPLGRQLTFCRVYESTRMKLLQRPGMDVQLRQQATAWIPSSTTPRANWRFLKLRGANIPIPPGSWEVRSSTSTDTPLLTLVSKGNPEYSAVLLGFNETYQKEGGKTYQLFLGNLSDVYEFSRELYSRDLSLPCDPRHSVRAIVQDLLLMILKALAAPLPGTERQVYRHPAGFIAVVMPSRQGKRWLVDTYFKPAGENIHATYVVAQKTNANALLDQLIYVDRKDLPSPPLPAHLESIQRNFGK